MQPNRQTPGAVGENARDWPRDFDVRAEYAEQQELLAPAGQPAAAPSPAQDTQHHE